jgi:hypothetical protein
VSLTRTFISMDAHYVLWLGTVRFSSICVFGANPPAGAGHIAWRSVVPTRPAGLADLRDFHSVAP